MDNVTFQDIIQYAPWLLVAFLFFKQNKMFVTPEQLQEEIGQLKEKIEEKYVLKEVYSTTIQEIKNDISEIKNDNKDVKTMLNSLYKKWIKN